MLSEEFDKKIVESLENHSPDFDERSWEKMEKLLDKHLPQKKDERRRFIFLFFIFLVAGGGAALLIFNNRVQKYSNEKIIGANKPAITTLNEEKKQPLQFENPKQNEIIKNNIPESENINPINEPSAISKTSQKNIFVKNNSLIVKKPVTISPNKKFTSKKDKQQTIADHTVIPTPQQSVEPSIIKKETKIISGDSKINVAVTAENLQPKELEQKKEMKDVVEAVPSLSEKATANNVTAIANKNDTKAPKNQQKNSSGKFSLSVSAGPDLSTVGLSKPGKTKLAYGAGISYKISNHFSIRSGFYIGRKIYTAGPQDYNPPANFWSYYPNLKTIEADCKVYDVPLNIDYYFNSTKKQSWFVSAGTSSLFMKKEVYKYYFKPPSSPQYISYSRTFKNQNKHYFSILNLSGGYSRKINSHLTMQAEPYMKIALNGVGYGKVKLNSGGILFTASFTPFQKNK